MKSPKVITEINITGQKEPFYQYRLNEAAAALGVSRKTLDTLIAEGKITTVPLFDNQIDGERRIPYMELMRYVNDKYRHVDVLGAQMKQRISEAA